MDRSFLITLATTLGIQGSVVVQSILTARMLGPSGRGEFAAILLWPAIFSGLGLLGINSGLARLAARPGLKATGLRTAAALVPLTSALTVCAGLLLLPWLIPASNPRLLQLARLSLLFVPLNHLGEMLQGVYQGSADFKHFNLLRLSFYPAYLLCLAATWFIHTENLVYYVCGFLVAQATVILLQTPALAGAFREGRGIIPFRDVAKESKPFALATCGTLLYLQLDKLLVLYLMSTTDLGNYVVAGSAAAAFSSITTSMGILGFSRAANRERGRGFQEVRNMFRQAVLLSLAGALAMAFLLPFLIPLAYGAAFKPAVWVAVALLPATIFSGLGQLLSQFLRGQGRPYEDLVAKSACLVTLALGGIPLGSRFGIFGFVAVLAVAQAVYMAVLVCMTVRHYQAAQIRHLIPGTGDVQALAWRGIDFLRLRQARGHGTDSR